MDEAHKDTLELPVAQNTLTDLDALLNSDYMWTLMVQQTNPDGKYLMICCYGSVRSHTLYGVVEYASAFEERRRGYRG